MLGLKRRCSYSICCGLLLWHGFLQAATFRIATYNLENYLDAPTETRPAKSPESKAKIRESVLAIRPDVIALQEVGTTNALLELRDSLKGEGLDLPYWEHIAAFDTNIHVAVLSRFPFAARRPHTNENFLLSGRRFQVSRGFAELEIRVNANYSFVLLAAHLKSKRAVSAGDEAEIRLEEAKLLREKIDGLLAGNPEVNLVVLGDLNDTKDSPSTKTIIGRFKGKLLDTRPAENNATRSAGGPGAETREVTWTHYYGVNDTYSRIDFLLLSAGMVREWQPNATYVLSTITNWGLGSDHRPITATFEAQDL